MRKICLSLRMAAILLSFGFLLTTFTACPHNVEKTPEYTVTFQNDGEIIDQVKVVESRTAEKPADPVKEGYTFLGWFEDGAESAFDFETKITKDITLTAKWKIIPQDDPEDNPGDNPEDNPGDNPEDNPGDNPEDNPGDDPEDNPGDDPEDNPPVPQTSKSTITIEIVNEGIEITKKVNEGVTTLSATQGFETYLWLLNETEYSTQREITLSNLPAGTYLFTVKAKRQSADAEIYYSYVTVTVEE